MNVDKYFEELNNKLNSLSNKELKNILIQAGIEDCPFQTESYSFKLTAKASTGLIYKTGVIFNDFSNLSEKVA